MFINIYDFEATLQWEEAAAASDSSEMEGLIRFDIYYFNRTIEFSNIENTQMTDEGTRMKYRVKQKDSYTENPVCRSFSRSELTIMNSDDDNKFTDLAVAAVPGRWVEETANRFSWVAGSVVENYDRTAPAASHHDLVVKVKVRIVSVVVNANESSVPAEIDEMFRRLQEDALADSMAVYEPATLSSVQELAVVPDAGQLDPNDRCTICLDKYGTDNNINGGGGGGGEQRSSAVVMMPCLHKYHDRCIFEWLKTKHECPLCRFPLPHEQVILRPPTIEDLTNMNDDDDDDEGGVPMHH